MRLNDQILNSTPQDFLETYSRRKEIEFLFSSLYNQFDPAHSSEATRNTVIEQLSLLRMMPTNGAFSKYDLDKASSNLGILDENHCIVPTPDYLHKLVKTNIHHTRASITRLIRAIENAIMTWGNPNDSVPVQLLVTLLYLAWIFPAIRLCYNAFLIGKYVGGHEGSTQEKELPWTSRAWDQWRKCWPEITRDVVWINLRATSCFAFPLPTPPALSVGLFSSAALIATGATICDYNTYHNIEVDDEAAKQKIYKNRLIALGFWVSYLIGAICGVFDSPGLAIGSSWIALTCIGQIIWEQKIRENPLRLHHREIPQAANLSNRLLITPTAREITELPSADPAPSNPAVI